MSIPYPDDPRHGTPKGYYGLGCRGACCRAANAEYQAALRAIRGPLPAGDPRHGTVGGYTNHKCRCAECRAANTRKVADANVRRRAAGLPAGDPRHGTVNGYDNYGCRCDDCRIANAAKHRASRQAAALRRRTSAGQT